MSPPVVRAFARHDRDQLTALVNAHIGAVVPGWAVPVNAVMSQLERDPGEWVVDPWVVDRATFVAEVDDRIVAAAHLCRYGDHERVGDSFRGAGEVKWLVGWPAAPEALAAVLSTAVAQLERWQVVRQLAGVSLPTPATYGMSDCWPHLRAAVVDAGFRHVGKVEHVMCAAVAGLVHAARPSIDGLRAWREVAESSTRFAAAVGSEEVAWFHVQPDLTAGGLLGRLAGWAGVWERGVHEVWRRRGIGRWLVSEAADWLQLGGVHHLLDQVWPEEVVQRAFLEALGFRPLTRVEVGWAR